MRGGGGREGEGGEERGECTHAQQGILDKFLYSFYILILKNSKQKVNAKMPGQKDLFLHSFLYFHCRVIAQLQNWGCWCLHFLFYICQGLASQN